MCVCLCASCKRKEEKERQHRADTDVHFMPPYPPGHSGVGPLFKLRVCGKAVPHDVGCVVLVPQLWTALKQEVYDEELDTGVQAWRK